MFDIHVLDEIIAFMDVRIIPLAVRYLLESEATFIN